MSKSSLTLLLTLSLLIVSISASAQVRFPTVFLGKDTIPEVTDLPYFPKNTFVVVQFCGLREQCMVTKFYVDKLNKEGVDITFFAVLDRQSESMRSLSDRFFHQTTIDWGMHISKESAKQAYILNADRKVVYQGSIKEVNRELFTAVEKEEVSRDDFAVMVKRQAAKHRFTKGVWLYKERLYPVQLTVMDLLRATSLGRNAIFKTGASGKEFVSTDYKEGAVVPALIEELGFTIEAIQEQEYTIEVNLEAPLEATTKLEGSMEWEEVIKEVTKRGVLFENYQKLIERLAGKTTQPVVTNVLCSEILDQLKDRGLRFKVLREETFELLAVK